MGKKPKLNYSMAVTRYRAYPWWHHQMEASCASLTLSVGNSPVTGEFLSQRTSNADFDVSWCGYADAVRQRVEWSVIWDWMMFMWRHLIYCSCHTAATVHLPYFLLMAWHHLSPKTSATIKVMQATWRTSVMTSTGLILGLCPANERRRYKVVPSLIGWAQTYNQPLKHASYCMKNMYASHGRSTLQNDSCS